MQCPFHACVALGQTHQNLGFHPDLCQTSGKQCQPHCPTEIRRIPEIRTIKQNKNLLSLPYNLQKKTGEGKKIRKTLCLI